MKANKGPYWTLGEAISWIRTRGEQQAPIVEAAVTHSESARATEELLKCCRAGRVYAVGRRCIWPDPSLKYSVDIQNQMRWATAVFSRGHPNDRIEEIPPNEWIGLEWEPEGEGTCSLRGTHSGRRAWTTVQFSQADIKREWPSSSMRRRGRKPDRLEGAKEAMRAEIDQKQLTLAELKSMKGKQLVDRYKVRRTTASTARKAVLKEIEPAGN